MSAHYFCQFSNCCFLFFVFKKTIEFNMYMYESEVKVKVLVAQLCLTLCNTRDWSPPGSSVHGILQARILEWVAMLCSRGSSQPGIDPRFPALQEDSLPSEPPRKPYIYMAIYIYTHILNKSLLSDMWFTNTFSQSVSSAFIFLAESFTEQSS